MAEGVVDRIARGFHDSAPFVIVSPGKCIRHVVGVVLLRDDGAALLQHRDNISTIPDPGLWVFPGGHLERRETPQDRAVREVEEETCYRCHHLRSLTRVSIEEVEILFVWENYDARQRVECREGQGLKFVDRKKLESMPRGFYLTAVFDLALVARMLTNVPIRDENQFPRA